MDVYRTLLFQIQLNCALIHYRHSEDPQIEQFSIWPKGMALAEIRCSKYHLLTPV